MPRESTLGRAVDGALVDYLCCIDTEDELADRLRAALVLHQEREATMDGKAQGDWQLGPSVLGALQAFNGSNQSASDERQLANRLEATLEEFHRELMRRIHSHREQDGM